MVPFLIVLLRLHPYRHNREKDAEDERRKHEQQCQQWVEDDLPPAVAGQLLERYQHAEQQQAIQIIQTEEIRDDGENGVHVVNIDQRDKELGEPQVRDVRTFSEKQIERASQQHQAEQREKTGKSFLKVIHFFGKNFEEMVVFMDNHLDLFGVWIGGSGLCFW